ncbi:MAG: thiol reductant ABC exporter subunit CydD [Candidatus Nanopelagicaceae bacterium]|nr:thiol reductant ABC exporter subunit CydD [Candidatus Nanopelagicaceae bacterium]
MKFLDPRLFRISRSSRGLILIAVLSAILITVATIAQAFLLAELITGAFQRELKFSALQNTLNFLILVFAVRVILTYVGEQFTNQISHRIRVDLRRALFNKILTNGAELNVRFGPGRISLISTKAIANLEPYFTRFVPQIFIAASVPLFVGATITYLDLTSGLIVLFTVPLIPLFGVLIGKYTSEAMRKRWRTLGILSGYVLDLLSGLTTLKLFGRDQAQGKQVEEVGNRYRVETMRVLKISFLTSLALEIIATLSVALIAVAIGLRLVDGEIELWRGLVILILAPEVYWPIRNLSAQFHASADGMQSAKDIFEIIDFATPKHVGTTKLNKIERISWSKLLINYPNRDQLWLPDGEFEIGKLNLITGPSGAGKTTLVNVLMGLLQSDIGAIQITDSKGVHDYDAIDINSWLENISWVPQDPHFPSGSIQQFIQLSSPKATNSEINEVLQRVGLQGISLNQPVNLSVGQKRRLAIARALLHPHEVLIMDEPSAALDPESEALIIELLRAQVVAGKLVIVISHRAELKSKADKVFSVEKVLS